MANANPPSNSAPNQGAAPDSALDLLSDLEERLGALRNWQSQSEAQAEKVRQQSHELDGRKQELEDLQKSIEAAQAEVERGRQELENDRVEATEAREALDRQRDQLDEQQRQLDDRRQELDDRFAQAEREAAQRQAEIDAEEQRRLDAATEKQRQVDESQAALEEARERIESREHRLDEAYAKLREEEGYLLNQQEAHQAKVAEVEAKLTGFDERQAELDRLATELESQKESLDARAQEIDAQAQELRTVSEKVQAEIADLESRQKGLDEVAAELESQKDEIKQSRTDLHRVQLDQQLRAEALLAQEEALAKARESLIDQATTGEFNGNAGDTPVKESQETTSAADVEKLRQDAEQARAELAEANGRVEERQRELRDLKAALDDRATEIELLEEQVAQLKDASSDPQAASPAPADLDARIQAHEAEIADLQAQLAEKTDAFDRAQLRILELETEPDTPAGTSTDAAEFEARLAERDAQLANVRAELETRTAEVAQLRQRIDELSNAAPASGIDADLDDEDYDRRRAELDEQAAQIAADRQRILERKAQLKEADAIIKRRREKIRKYIRQIKQSEIRAATGTPSALSASDHARLAGVEKQRAALAEVKQFLEQSEAAMVQRWATQRTGSFVVSLIIAVILAVGFSFFAASQLTQPVFRATMAVEVTPTEDTADLPPNAWLSSYKQTLLSEAVLSEAINQLDQRGLRVAGTPTELADHLKQTLTVEGQPDRVTLAYHGPDPTRIGAVLEAYGRGLMVFHMTDDRRAGRLNDTATILQPAAVVPEPVQDERLNYALAIFAGLVGFAAVVALPLRLIAGRSRRVLDPRNMPELSALDEPEDDLVDDGPDEGIANDGPPAGFSRLPDTDADEADEKTFRF